METKECICKKGCDCKAEDCMNCEDKIYTEPLKPGTNSAATLADVPQNSR